MGGVVIRVRFNGKTTKTLLFLTKIITIFLQNKRKYVTMDI